MSESAYPSAACQVCNDTKVIWSPDLDGESMYESACPEPIHDVMERAARQFTEDRQAMEREDAEPADERPRTETDCRCSIGGGEECPCEADGDDGLCACCRAPDGEHRGTCAGAALGK